MTTRTPKHARVRLIARPEYARKRSMRLEHRNDLADALRVLFGKPEVMA